MAVANPAQVRQFAQALGRSVKTDSVDAAVIAGFAEAIKAKAKPLPDADTAALAGLAPWPRLYTQDCRFSHPADGRRRLKDG